MKAHSISLLRAGLALALAVVLAASSSLVQREGPELVTYGNLCGPKGNENCYKPALKGGFPAPYLFDAPGISVERQLSFGEDNLRLVPLALDIAIYWAAIMLAVWFTNRQSASPRYNANHGEAQPGSFTKDPFSAGGAGRVAFEAPVVLTQASTHGGA